MWDCFKRGTPQSPSIKKEAQLGKKNRQIEVSAEQLIQSPYNNIGWIQSKYNSDEQTIKKGTGFLISQSLVLTSAHNFIYEDNQLGEATECEPISFSIHQPKENGSGSVLEIYEIKRIKINSQFLRLAKVITSATKEVQQKQQIASLQKYMIQHDFALLQLKKPIIRTHYFELSPTLPQKCALAVSGYVHYGQNYSKILTHTDKLNQIANKAIYYNIDTQEGQSGGPVYILAEGDQAVQVVGIHQGYDPEKKKNLATMITEPVIAVLKQWAAQMDASFGDMNQNSNLNKLLDNCINKLREKGDELRNKVQFKRALSYYSRSLQIHKKAKIKESVEYAKTLGSIGVVHLCEGRFQQSLEYFTKELIIYEGQKQSLEKAHAITNISIVQKKLGINEKSKENYLLAVEIYQKQQIRTEKIKCPYKLHSIGQMHFLQNQGTKALKYYSKVLAIHQKIGKQSLNCADTLKNIGLVYYNQDNSKALTYYNEAVVIYKDIGRESISWASTLYNIGLVHYNEKDIDKAINYCGEAQAIYEKIGKESTGLANTLNNIGFMYFNKGLIEKALDYYKRSIIIYQKIGQESIDWSNVLENIGSALRKQKKFKQALQYYSDEVKIHQKLGTQSIKWAQELNKIGIGYQICGKHKDALDCFDKALQIYEKVGKKSAQYAETLNNKGMVYRNHDKLKQSLEQYGRALDIYIKIGKESIGRATALINIAIVYQKQGQLCKATNQLGKAETIHENIGKESIQYAENLQSIGQFYKRQGIHQKWNQYMEKSNKMKLSLK